MERALGQLGIVLRDGIRSQGIAVAGQWQVVTCGMGSSPRGWRLAAEHRCRSAEPFFGARHGMRACHVDLVPLHEAN